MKRFFLLGLAGMLILACSPKVVSHLSADYPALDPDAEVLVLEENTPQSLLAGTEILGTVRVGDTGFSSTQEGSYEAVLELAKDQARQAGGNVLRITRHLVPDGFSSIHRIEADVLRIPETHPLWAQEQAFQSDHPDYAIIFLYRPAGSAGALVSYDVRIGDTPVFRAKNGTKAEVKIYEEGQLEIWGRTETKVSLPLDVKLGEEYYIRCSVSMGALIGHPYLQKVSRVSGKAEYDAIRND